MIDGGNSSTSTQGTAGHIGVTVHTQAVPGGGTLPSAASPMPAAQVAVLGGGTVPSAASAMPPAQVPVPGGGTVPSAASGMSPAQVHVDDDSGSAGRGSNAVALDELNGGWGVVATHGPIRWAEIAATYSHFDSWSNPPPPNGYLMLSPTSDEDTGSDNEDDDEAGSDGDDDDDEAGFDGHDEVGSSFL
ncbi:hypothetical protein CBR_g18627 [Chara braunii]|uniref:Uncharacterized protein n=1 Tax=Chara braunii TaxID=69332 RepID=A0A388JTJ7_CHABU|nr:hypothetical protein CBR_g18627 [Chara braunii]|eukprot:GBG61032.1 hypothetical protein CBR_g18627 [Chara braunii]